jgi:LmbE family N-acetylglucosaminyl deacetylase
MSTQSRPRAAPRILGVFAHPDDESYCAGGTLARYVAGGAEAMVVSATRGEAGQIRCANLATRRTLGAMREQELAEACRILGVQHMRCLDYQDGKLHKADPQELAGEVVRLVRGFRPDVVITFGTDGAYGHPDHIAICEATTRACTVAGDSQAYPEQLAEGLSPYAPPRLYYSHFPRSRLRLMDWLVEWQMSFSKRFRGTVDFVQAISLFAEESAVLRYASDHIDVQWYPPGFYIVEQGEPATSLYLIVSGNADAVGEDAHGNLTLLEHLTAGQFFGEIALATGKRRTAHVIAVDHVTCVVFSPGAPTTFAGRGEEAGFAVVSADPTADDLAGATTCIDTSAFVSSKISAIAAHQTQCPIRPDMFPPEMLRAMFSKEYFLRVLPRPELESSLFS